MGDSKKPIELEDAVDDFDASDLLDAIAEFDEESEISSVIRAAKVVGSARYILPTSDDAEAPEVTCDLMDEFPDERETQSSRSIGHGLRPLRQAQHLESDEDTPNVVVRIDI